MSETKRKFWEIALPKIDVLDNKKIIMGSTPKSDNFWYGLWCESFELVKIPKERFGSEEKERGITIIKK